MVVSCWCQFSSSEFKPCGYGQCCRRFGGTCWIHHPPYALRSWKLRQLEPLKIPQHCLHPCRVNRQKLHHLKINISQCNWHINPGSDYRRLRNIKPSHLLSSTDTFICFPCFITNDRRVWCHLSSCPFLFFYSAPTIFKQWTDAPKTLYHIIVSHINAVMFDSLPSVMRSRDSVVGIAKACGLDDRGVGVRAPVGSRIFSPPRRPDRHWGPSSLLSNAYRGLFPRG
jgi:hypothetical protein